VRRGDRFLALREASHEQGWYLPAGRCEAGERLTDAAVRECLEETGVPVVLDGIWAIQHTTEAWGARIRVIFSAHPSDDSPPKTTPDEHSLEARWVTPDEMAALPLRHPEVLALFRRAAAGAVVHPLSVLSSEG
jgi:8-oxo-dGTP pyrophosphatase MutT (NUDIX family)